MKFRALNRVPVEGNEDTFIQEPNAGLMSAFVSKLTDFPRLPGDGDRIDTVLFSGARILLCLFENQRIYLASLVNYLNSQDATLWPITVLETDSARQVLDALETPYFARVVEWFTEQLPAGEFSSLNKSVRTVWPELDDKSGNG